MGVLQAWAVRYNTRVGCSRNQPKGSMNEMTEEKQEEKPVQTIELQDVVNKVGGSFYAAACMILGTKQEVYDNSFKLGAARDDDKLLIFIEEQVTGDGINLAIPVEIAVLDDDSGYFEDLKKLACLVEPHITEEDKIIPKDEWPEPVWKEPEPEETPKD